MKEKFDAFTDLVEHTTAAQPAQQQMPPADQQVVNAQGEKVTLNDKKHPDIF